MADDSEKDEKKAEESQVVANVATLDLPQIIVALHQKALTQIKSTVITVQNSAVEGEGKKGSTFYGAGQHIIAAIPKDAKSLDEAKVKRSEAFEVLKNYVQWFAGPDVVAKVKLEALKPLDDGADGNVKDNSKAKADIEKSKKDEVAGQKYESFRIPSFSEYLILEDGKEEDSGEEAEKQPAKAENPEDKAESSGADPEAEGWYIDYRVSIPGEKENSIADALKHFGKDLLRNFGIKSSGLWGDGDVKTVGDAMDAFDSVFGKMDANKFVAEVNNELKKRMKQTDASAQVWDVATIKKYLKKEIAQYKSQLSQAELACCIRVSHQDKSYKLFNVDAVANVLNAAIEGTGAMRGLGKRMRGFGIKSKDVILVNNFQDNKKASGEEAKYRPVEDSLAWKPTPGALLEALLGSPAKKQKSSSYVGSSLLEELFGKQLLESAAWLMEEAAEEEKKEEEKEAAPEESSGEERDGAGEKKAQEDGEASGEEDSAGEEDKPAGEEDSGDESSSEDSSGVDGGEDSGEETGSSEDPAGSSDAEDSAAGEEDEKKPDNEKSFTIDIVLPDQEDQQNPKKTEQIATIRVVNGLYKPEDLESAAKEAEEQKTGREELDTKKKELSDAKDEFQEAEDSLQAAKKKGDADAKKKAKNDKNAASEKIEALEKEVADLARKYKKSGNDPEELRSAAADNKKAFGEVDNIGQIESREQAHGLKFDRWEPSLEKIAAEGVPAGEEKATVRAVFKGATAVKRTDIDFYIIPMKGLKDGEGEQK